MHTLKGMFLPVIVFQTSNLHVILKWAHATWPVWLSG